MSKAFRSLDASNLSFFNAMHKKEAEAGGEDFKDYSLKVMPLIDAEKKTITHATFQKHYKFAVLERIAPTDEKLTYQMIIGLLIYEYDVPSEFFQGGGMIPKCGLCVFPDTEHNASIRLWCSKKVAKSVIYEVTVSSYKDSVPEPTGDKPSQWKKVVIPE